MLLDDPVAHIPIEKVSEKNWDFIFEQVNRETKAISKILRFIIKKCNTISNYDCDSLLSALSIYMENNDFTAITMDLSKARSQPKLI